MIKALIERILHRHEWYRIDELAIGGHCGICGAWIPNEIFPKHWRWGVCITCKKESEEW